MTNKYGHMNISRHMAASHDAGRKLAVRLDGVDVTDRCQEANDTSGSVTLLCHDQEHHRDWRVAGRAHIMPDADDRPCVLRVRGDVDIV